VTNSVKRAVTLSLVFSLLAAGGVVFVLGNPQDLRALGRLQVTTILACFGLITLSYLAGACRILILVRQSGYRLGFWRAGRAYILGLFSAAVTPGGGGHGVAIAFTLQRDGLSGSSAWSTAVYLGVLDLLFYAWTLPLSLVILGIHPQLGERWLLYIAVPVGLLILCIWFIIAHKLHWLRPVLIFLLQPPGLRRWRRPALRFAQKFAAGTRAMTHLPVQGHAGLQLITIVQHFASHLMFYVLVTVLAAPVALLPTLALVQITVSVANIIPTPGGSGYMELALSLLFAQQASVAQIASAVLAWRAFSFYLSLILGFVLGGAIFAKTLTVAVSEKKLSAVKSSRQ
jgi:uncharacterized protein (TIRG00374 family)